MNFQVGKEYHGFALMDRQSIVLNNVNVLHFKHIKSGAQLIYFDTPDDNCGFSIKFKTYSLNDTGVAHVLEHCVLAGSRKYGDKEPLSEFVRGIYGARFNGRTHSDYTSYYIVNNGEKNFLRMMDILMDSVFYPIVYENENIFLQEAWRYDIDEETDDLKLNGIVYNEIKRLESMPVRKMAQTREEVFFPNTHYAYRYGGICKSITKLTYSEVIEFHKKYYKADNALICMSGKLNIDKYLKFLDKEYLSAFEKTGCNYDEPVEVLLPGRKKYMQVNYPISGNLAGYNEALHSFSFYMPIDLTTGDIMALNMVFKYLSEDTKGSIKKVLESEGIFANVYFDNKIDIKYPIFTLYVFGAPTEKVSTIEKVIYNALRDIVNNGIDKDFIDCQRNSILYEDRLEVLNLDYSYFQEADYLDTYWLYGRESIEVINEGNKYEWLRDELSNEFYKNIVEKYLLYNKNVAVVNAIPDINGDVKETEPERGLEFDEKINWLKKLKNFVEWQNGPTDDMSKYYDEITEYESLNKPVIPQDVRVKKLNDDTFIIVTQPMNGIVSMEWWFDITEIDQELMPYIILHNKVLWECGSENYSITQKKLEYAKYIGESEYSIEKDSANSKIYLRLKIGVLRENIDRALEVFLKAISDISNILYYDLHKYLKQFLKQGAYYYGYSADEIAEKRIEYFYEEEDSILDELHTYIGLISQGKKLSELVNDMILKIRRINEFIYRCCTYKSGYTCDEEESEYIKQNIERFNASLYCRRNQTLKNKDFNASCNEGLIVQHKGQSIVFGVDLRHFSVTMWGAMRALVNILDRMYIREKIRIQGGAYNCKAKYISNYLTIKSERDPDIRKTYEIFNGIPDWLESADITQEDINREIVNYKAFRKSINYTREELLSEAMWRGIDEIGKEPPISTTTFISRVTVADVKALVPSLREAFKKRLLCVAANEDVIKANADLIDNVIDLRTKINKDH